MRKYLSFLLTAVLAAGELAAAGAQGTQVSGADDLHLRGQNSRQKKT